MITLKTLRSEAEKQVEAVAERLTKRSSALGAEAGKLAGDPTPAYAVVGLTDAVIEKARTATEKFGKVRTLTPQLVAEQLTKAGAEVTERVTKTAAGLSGQVTRATSDLGKTVEEGPTAVVSGVLTRLGKVQDEYAQLAKRGEGLVTRVRSQKATQDLVAQVEHAVQQGRQLLTTARTGAKQTRSTAKATVTSGRRQVAATIAPEATPAAAKATTAKPAAKKSTAKTTAKPAAKKSTAKTTAKKATAKSTTAKSTAARTAKPATRKATAPATGTKAAAKRTATTAAKRAEDTAGATKSTTDAMAKVAEKAAEAATDAATKTGTSTTAKADSATSDS
ncbi:MAG TPA: hypothetical protein VK038_11580 [Ornithinicoccus sp.]|jgi:hypothetical protein|nr:hypothetical protein [Ornithinicoccus sp.]